MTLPCISPFQPLDFKRDAGGQGGFERVQQEVSLLPHPTPLTEGSRSRMGCGVVFLKIQRAGPMKG